MSTDIETPNPCVLTLEEQLALLAILKKVNVKLGRNSLPTAPSAMPFGASSLGPNLQIKAIKLDTIQDIQTISTPTFAQITLGPESANVPIAYIDAGGGYKFYIYSSVASGVPSVLFSTFITNSQARANFEIARGTYNVSGGDTCQVVLITAQNIADPTSSANMSIHTNSTRDIGVGGTLTFGGRWTTLNAQAYNFAMLRGAKENTIDADLKGYLAFYTRPAYTFNANLLERMRISSDGYIGINTTGPTKRFSISEKLQIDDNGLPVKSNNISLAGQGNAIIVASGNAIGQTGAITSLASFTTLAAGGSFEVGGYLDVTAFTAGTISLLCDYTDPGGTARTLTIPLIALAGTVSGSVGSLTDASAVISGIQTSGANSIKIYTSVSLFTGTYNAYAWIKQIA